MTRRTPRFQKHKGRWNLIFYNTANGERKWVALDTSSKTTAARKARPMIRAWEDGDWSPFSDPWREEVSVGLAADLYERAIRGTLRPKSVSNATWLVRSLAETLPAGLPLSKVSPIEVRKLILRPKSEAGRRSYKRTLRAFYSWALREGYATENVAASIRLSRAVKKSPTYLSVEEVDALLEAIPDAWHRDLVRFAVGSGLRAGELVSLRYGDVVDGMIYVRGESSKSVRDRRVPLSSWARSAYESRLESHPGRPTPDEVVWPYSRSWVSHKTKRAIRDAKLPEEYRFHTLRHTFASWCRLRGVALDRIRDWLGHSTITTTEIYAHLAPESVKDEIEAVFA